MPKKRRVVRKFSKTSGLAGKSVTAAPLQNRISLAWKNLILFLVLFVVSLIFYKSSSDLLIVNLFGLLLIILGFLAFAFLIIWIVLLILRSEKR